MAPARRTWITATLALLAVVLYAADLLGLKPPPRILPSVVLTIAAVVVGVTPSRRPDGDERPRNLRPPSRAAQVMTITGFVLLILLLIPVMPIGLIAPGPGILAIHGVWLVGFIMAWRLRRCCPPVVLAIPFVTAVLIAAILWVGTTLLGWQP